MINPDTEFDSPWKDIIETYFEDFIRFFLPEAYEKIDWAHPPEFLDKELNQVVRDAELGKRFADKLVKVWFKDGAEKWIIIHVEVQSQDETDFAERMFVYHSRIYNRFRCRVVSLAILGDERKNWKPDRFGYEECGTSIDFRFSVVKLLEYKQSWSELEANRNPFAIVVIAHLQAQETQDNRPERKRFKMALIRRLYEEGYSKQDIINLFGFIDWVMSLPKDLEQEFWQELQQLEESMRMRYITSVERIGIEKGITEGLLEAIELGLELKFGSVGLQLLPEISKIKDVEQLRAIKNGIKTVNTIEELRQIYQPAG